MIIIKREVNFSSGLPPEPVIRDAASARRPAHECVVVALRLSAAVDEHGRFFVRLVPPLNNKHFPLCGDLSVLLLFLLVFTNGIGA